MTTKYYVTESGQYIGAFEGVEPPEGAVEVSTAPQDARQIWAGAAWGALPIEVPDSVSSRQFKMQLSIAGLKTQVEAWVEQQEELVQIAYSDSGTFVRGEPMMQQGFAALGFTDQQIDEFFTAAAAL